MEQYVLVGEFADQDSVNRACSLLEAQDVPVMVDHAERNDGFGPEMSYRILVPAELSQRSLATLSGLLPPLTEHFGEPASVLPRA